MKTGSAQGKVHLVYQKESEPAQLSLSQRQLESSEPCEAGPVLTKSAGFGVHGNSEICQSLRASLVSERQVMKGLIRGEKNKDIQLQIFIIAFVICALETTCKQKETLASG